MKVQDIILRAMAGKLKWFQAPIDHRDQPEADATVAAVLRGVTDSAEIFFGKIIPARISGNGVAPEAYFQ